MQHVHDILPDYLTDKLDDGLRQEVTDHLAVCGVCRAESLSLAETLYAVGSIAQPSLPVGYFSTVLPRVRQRVEHGGHLSWTAYPIVARFAAPLAAVIVVVALISQVSVERTDLSGQLLTGSITGSDVVDVMSVQPESLPLLGVNVEQLAASTLSTETLERQLAELLVVNGSESGIDEYFSTTSELLLNSLSDQEFETLLKRIDKRTL